MKIHGSPVRGRVTSFTSALLATALVAALATAQAAPIPTPGANAGAAPAAQNNNTPAVNNAAANNNAAGQAGASNSAETPKFLRFVRAGANGAKLRNIYDEQGVALSELSAGALLAVHGERAGWLDVEIPGGFPVWVFGEYLTPTSESGMLQVSGNDVRMRPKPSSGADSLPLRQLLARGTKVKMLGRNDMSKPLGEDWVRVTAPAGTRGWVATGQTEALAAGTDGATQWAAAVTAARAAAASAPAIATDGANSGGGSIAANETGNVTSALAAADKALAAERAKQERGEAANYDAVKKSYEDVLALNPAPSTAELVKERIELCAAYADGLRLSAELQNQKASIDAALRRRQEDMEKAAKSQPFDGRFDGRGFVETARLPGSDKPIYLVRFSGVAVAELQCSSGRFNLADFVGCEIGFNGREVRGGIASTNSALARPHAIDLARLEILTAAPVRR
ncbi:MAG: SH3 domain-containing protein [Planctomycetota bacterium]|nr:SH3 domain-containing protein [Planctomycetota bacterium]